MVGDVRTKLPLFFAAVALVSAQSSGSVWDGIYSAAQAAKGEALYRTECASCHAADLQGSGPMPALTGEDFRKEWDGQSVGDLFERIRTTMPGDKPGKLSPEVNANILAFLLKSNGYPAGTAELKADTAGLNKIRFQAQKR
jgi:mono/diheme cytochrome c family protein